MRTSELYNLVWKHIHPDFKGVIEGERTITMFIPQYGTCIVPLKSLTIAEALEKLPHAVRLQILNSGVFTMLCRAPKDKVWLFPCKINRKNQFAGGTAVVAARPENDSPVMTFARCKPAGRFDVSGYVDFDG